MKRVIPVILLFLLSGTIDVYCQLIESAGLKAGISLSNQSFRFTHIDYSLETDLITGPGIAVFMESFRRKHLSFQLDLEFVAKGSETNTQSVTINHLDNDRIIVNKGDLNVSKFYYLSLSPMARYRIGKELINPYALLGPRLDYLLKYNTNSDYPLEDQNSLILGLSAGVGVEFNIKILGVFIEVQYQPDISSVTSKDPLLINNNILLITLGVRDLNVN